MYTVSEDEGMGTIEVLIDNRPLQDSEILLIASKWAFISARRVTLQVYNMLPDLYANHFFWFSVSLIWFNLGQLYS